MICAVAFVCQRENLELEMKMMEKWAHTRLQIGYPVYSITAEAAFVHV